MKSIFDTPISCYRNVKDNVGTVTTLRDFLFCDQYMERIKNMVHPTFRVIRQS